MERCMLGITRRDRKRNTRVRSMTKVAIGRTHSEKNGWQMEARYTGMASAFGCEKQSRLTGRIDELRRMCGADCSRQSGMGEDWRGLYPAVDGERLKMIIILKKMRQMGLHRKNSKMHDSNWSTVCRVRKCLTKAKLSCRFIIRFLWRFDLTNTSPPPLCLFFPEGISYVADWKHLM
jgi:hypothetical protein